MATFYLTRAEGTAVGFDVNGAIGSVLTRAEGKAVGFPMLTIGAAPTAGAAPDAFRVEIVNSSGTQLANDLPQRRNLTFSVEHNGSGNISFEIDLDTLPGGVDDPLLDPNNLVRIHFGDLPGWPCGVAEGLLMAAPPVKNDQGRWVITLPCPGSWDALDYGVLWPPDGATGDTREFSYTAGQTGPSWVAEEWSTPHGYLVKNSFRWKHRYPRGWPESKARWLWSSSPEKVSGSATGFVPMAVTALTGILESRKFVGSFTLAAMKNVRFYVAGDDTLKFYLNGARVKTKGRGGWKRTASFTRTLKAGTYTIAAEVQNLAGGDGKCGFIFAAAQLKADGTRDKWLLRSNTSTFQVKTGGGYFGQTPLPPDGWYPAAVLHQHVAEAVARGVDFHSAIVQTFSTTADSYGTGWTEKGPAEYDINITGAELGDKVRSSGVDAAMLPGLQLCAWISRGFDLTGHVVLSTPLGVGWSSKTWARVRTVGVTHHDSGWTVTNGDSALSAKYGRRELPISAGGVDGDAQADIFAAKAMTAAASPEETIEATITAADLVAGAPMPFRDFNVADTIELETIGGFQPIKVMTITGTEPDSKTPRFTIAGYPV